MSQSPKNLQEESISELPSQNLLSGSDGDSKTTMNRRSFIQVTGAGLAGLSLVACSSDGDSKPFGKIKEDTVEFLHGVASGDPLSDKVILWTRVTPAIPGRIEVVWEISTDETMQNILNSGTIETSGAKDFTVKVDADGLEPATVYYYRFSSDGVSSTIGRTKTLPVGIVNQVKMVVFSCANYPAGYFHVYADAAKRDDVDVAVHLGDYIYEYGRYLEDNNLDGEFTKDDNGNKLPAYASYNAETLDRQVNPDTEANTIQGYRLRYAQYHTEKDLQALHAAMPMIVIWDDHEISNDSFKDGAENHQTKDGKWDERKIAAMTAYSEWLPIRTENINQIFRTFDFGNLLSLNMLDTRIFGRDKQLDYNEFIKATAQGVTLDAEAFTAAFTNPERQMLGLYQQNWLATQMESSTSTWQMLGQQVLMARMSIPSPILLNFNNKALGMDLPTYMGIVQKAQAGVTLTSDEQFILAQPSIPYNLDGWDGYFMARENLFGVAKALNKNLVVIAGDTHNAWASDLLDHQGNAIGVEFATSSVTSPGFEEYLPDVDPVTFAAVLPSLIESGTLKYMDASQRGYMVLTVTPEQCKSEWVFVSDILKTEYIAKVKKTLTVNVGENKINI